MQARAMDGGARQLSIDERRYGLKT